jgi:hypothetical protein
MLHTFSKFIIAFSFIVILTYLGFSFMFWSLNPIDWGLFGRSAYVMVQVFSAMIASVIVRC